jgi:glucuronokinase
LPVSENRQFASLAEFVESIAVYGYYASERLLLGALFVFADYCRRSTIDLPEHGFKLRYSTDIPRQVGLGGSSAIVTAVLQALAQFYSVGISRRELATLGLSVETTQLGIAAALIDRAVQAHDAPVLEDASGPEPVITLLEDIAMPKLFVAYCQRLAGESGKTMHNDMRRRWERRENKVIEVVKALATCAEDGVKALRNRDFEAFGRLMTRNFRLREQIYTIPSAMKRMIEVGEGIGSHVKFAGSGGAIVGTYEDEPMLDSLKDVYRAIGCSVVPVTS